ncbi:hypothetical protein M427DRAFT_72795 [Gonapodya prolifera JEL478]|uniref:Uncharacterized protein n=1 Tax=Gonapodya prolifera (strain JEL478) TaxID=1344416 RepID=A0A139A3Z7_GONPJ|nr:hypothetical protein M427DRAFT_72795 [Gonapodya prolifera JEL478]|eukprot:KXS11532.1 hypothetical protein M427DRAFT_72795 [Gonapodya prolifera JEL478]
MGDGDEDQATTKSESAAKEEMRGGEERGRDTDGERQNAATRGQWERRRTVMGATLLAFALLVVATVAAALPHHPSSSSPPPSRLRPRTVVFSYSSLSDTLHPHLSSWSCIVVSDCTACSSRSSHAACSSTGYRERVRCFPPGAIEVGEDGVVLVKPHHGGGDHAEHRPGTSEYGGGATAESVSVGDMGGVDSHAGPTSVDIPSVEPNPPTPPDPISPSAPLGDDPSTWTLEPLTSRSERSRPDLTDLDTWRSCEIGFFRSDYGRFLTYNSLLCLSSYLVILYRRGPPPPEFLRRLGARVGWKSGEERTV